MSPIHEEQGLHDGQWSLTSLIKKQILQLISSAWSLISVFVIWKIIRKRNLVPSSICGTGAWLLLPSPPLLAAPSRLGFLLLAYQEMLSAKWIMHCSVSLRTLVILLLAKVQMDSPPGLQPLTPTTSEQRRFQNLPTTYRRETPETCRRGHWLFLSTYAPSSD